MIEYHIRVGKRVLQEFAWREENLGKPDVHPFALEGLLYAVAAECRSEVGFAVHSLSPISPPKRAEVFTQSSSRSLRTSHLDSRGSTR